MYFPALFVFLLAVCALAGLPARLAQEATAASASIPKSVSLEINVIECARSRSPERCADRKGTRAARVAGEAPGRPVVFRRAEG